MASHGLQQSVDLEGGRKATFEVIGDGPPALMLPGGPGFAASYMRGAAALLGDVWQCYLIDPHGSGGSTPPAGPEGYSAEGHVAFYDEVREALGLGAVTVIGHSFGATTTLTYAALRPESVTRAVALAPFGLGTETDEAGGGEAADEMEAMAGRHSGSAWYPAAKEALDTWTERVLAAREASEVEQLFLAVMPLYFAYPDRPDMAAAIEEFAGDVHIDLAAVKAWEGGLYQGIDLRPVVGRIRAPTLIIAGELDLICGPAQAVPISEAISGATLDMIPECGHMLVAEAGPAVRTAVDAWLG